MKTLTTVKATMIILANIATANVEAHGDHPSADRLASTQISEVIYDNPAYNRGIHGYPNLVPSVPIAKIDPIYVDKAHGPAIYSYPSNAKR